ncbi:hypothetical protein L9W92_14555 [Pelotomaculum terephthalicicum JT]|uniref:hypothetical protein n=1 Tax=Pelotomaculum TaxID=191373 RepID=UPI0009CB2845|nr:MULTISPECIES: hypothetical protein [Pelotomaculum]MCG9969242.1 hypothetical protein [Pelotomaculum terephthalicicum JT]OPX86058.1 MAG: hypothetical protein A4E54_02108 [Pelotomaculum sp. PtaB.Bin117]OPY61167.1 MAG: hypothetical protein A4E56_02224 [Pelotomaculum sp. PtaU1.Bin065]
MEEYLDDLRESFFTWCDNAVQVHIEGEGTMLKRWRPRRNPDGSYDLILKLIACDETTSMLTVPIPEEYHDLLEREYFINHPPDEEEES